MDELVFSLLESLLEQEFGTHCHLRSVGTELLLVTLTQIDTRLNGAHLS